MVIIPDTLNIFGIEYPNATGIKLNESTTPLTLVRPTGTKSITQNGTGIDVSTYASVDVAVPASAPSLQTKTKTYTPTESQQTETITADSGYDGLEEVDVTVNAVSSSYVGSGITRRSSSDLTASGATVTVPSGYYQSNASKAVSSGSATAPASISGTSATVSTGTNTLTLSKTVSVTPTVSAGYVSSGTAGNASVSLQASVTTKAAATYNTSASDQTISANQYLTGAQTIRGVVVSSNLTAENVKSGVTITVGDADNASRIKSVTGTYSGGGGSSKNIQAYLGYDSRTGNGYASTSITLTVAKAGTYKVCWCAWRGSSSGTMGTNLYKNGTAGTNQQTWTGTYGQCITLNSQSYNQGDVLTLYATAGNNSRTVYVGNLIIEEQ